MSLNSKGITLTEILVTLAITAVVVTLLATIFSQNNRLFYNQQTKVSHGISSNEVINQIDDAIRGAISVEAQYPAQNPTYTSGDSTLILKLPSIDGSGNVISGVFDYMVFSKDLTLPAILRQIIYTDPQSARKSANKVISTTLKSLTITYLSDVKATVSPTSASLVNYSLILSSKQGDQTIESSASGQTRLRNN